MPLALEESSAVSGIKPKVKNYEDYSQAKACYDKLISGWSEIEEETSREQDIRYLKGVESEALRDAGILKADELYTGLHLIDTNIRAEQPSLVQYLTQSRRSIIFASPNNTPIDGIEKLEANFTTVARTLGWEIPFIRCFDGAQAHGWDSVEVVFDAEEPGGFRFEHVGHGSLVFNTESEDIEAQEVVLRKINLTSKQLREYVEKFGFSSEAVEELIDKSGKSEHEQDCPHTVYKGWYKKDGVVYNFWYKQDLREYLMEPRILFLGRRNVTTQPVIQTDEIGEPLIDPAYDQPMMDYPELLENKYPVIVYRYIESSDPRITETRGRVKLDEAAQEAAGAIQTGLVNGILRASNVYAAPAIHPTNQAPNDAPKITKTVLANGSVYDQPLTFFGPKYPDQSVMAALEAIVRQNKAENARVDMAAMSRKDSNKTATEIASANEKSNELSTVQVILVSIFIRNCYSRAWSIYQNLVLQQKIQITDQSLAALFPAKYIIKSSGDVDVIQRQEHITKMMQSWPVISSTPMAAAFLEDIIRYQFPEDAERYIQAGQQAMMSVTANMGNVVQQISNVLAAIVTDESGNIKPEYAQYAQELQQLSQNVSQMMGQASQERSIIPMPGSQGGQQQQPAQKKPQANA